jgi:hypothetical protein
MARLRKMVAQARGLDFPPRVAERQHPRRVCADVIAVALRLENAGQLDFVRQILGEPLLIRPHVVAVEGKAPFAVERKGFNGAQVGGCQATSRDEN